MEERRQALGMTWAEVASEADITVETLRAVRRGNNQPSPLTKRGLEQALRWQTGSVDAIYANRDPQPLPDDMSEASQTNRQPPNVDLDSYVPQSAVERAIIQMYQATLQQERQERAELRRKLDEIDEKLNRLTRDSDGDDGRGARSA